MVSSRSWRAAIVAAALVLGCAGESEPGAPAADGRPPNLLLVHSDQHRADALGCEGHPLVRTPNLDRLAARGVRFTSAYVQTPLCVPSRASLFTGRYPQLHRATNNLCELPEDETTWAEHLVSQGYTARAIGRVHGIYRGCEYIAVPGRGTIGEVMGAADPDLPEEERHWDTRVADRAIEELGALAESEQPWALYVGFFSPHPPHVPPEPYADLYSPAKVPPPDFDPDWLARQPSWQRLRVQPAGQKLRKGIAGYYGLTTHLDHEVGRVLETLEELGLGANTLVVYTSDHGAPLGDHGQSAKDTSFFESVLRVPAILSLPGTLPSGAVVDHPVAQIDLVPTFLSLLGQPPSEAFVGTDLGPLLAGAPDAGPDYVFSTIDFAHREAHDQRGLMIRRGPWKLSWYTTDEGELYNLERDPGETRNLFEARRHAEVRDALWAELVDHMVWMWSLAPERTIEHGACELALDSDPPVARLSCNGWELRAGLDGERELVAPEGGGDEGTRSPDVRRRSMEKELVRALAVGLGPAHHRPLDAPRPEWGDDESWRSHGEDD